MTAARCNPRVFRILFCNYEYPPIGGGGGTCSHNLARQLVRRGHEVEVVTARYRGLKRSVRFGGLHIRRIAALRSRPDQSNPLEMASYALSAGLHLLARNAPRPDMVVSFHTIPSGLAAFPYCRLHGVPHIALLRGGDVPGWLPQRMAGWHRATLPLNRMIVYTSSACLANSDGLRALAQRAFPRKKIGVLQNGVDLRAFCPPRRPRSARGDSTLQLLFVGRITSQKGIDSLLRAMARRQFATVDWKLNVVGDGPQLAEYVELSKELGIIDRVNFRGWVQRRELRGHYDSADMLVFPSRYEGMPNAVLEATGCGLPVVATRTAGTVQIVRDGENGFLVDVDDEDALAQRIGTLMTDRPLRLRLGENGRRIAEAQWSWEARAAELEKLIAGILD